VTYSELTRFIKRQNCRQVVYDLEDSSKNTAASDATLQVIHFTSGLVNVKRPYYCTTHHTKHNPRGSVNSQSLHHNS